MRVLGCSENVSPAGARCGQMPFYSVKHEETYTHTSFTTFFAHILRANMLFLYLFKKARKIRGFFILRFSRVPEAPDTWFTREKTVFSNAETSARQILIEKIRVKVDFLQEDRKASNLSGF